MIIQNLHILLSIHPPLNLSKFSHTIPAHTAPYHDVPTPKLHSSLYLPLNQPIPCFPSNPILLILVSSDQITFFQSSTVHSLCLRAKANHFFLCTVVSNGFFFFVTALNECCLSTFLTVCGQTGWEMMVLMCLVT